MARNRRKTCANSLTWKNSSLLWFVLLLTVMVIMVMMHLNEIALNATRAPLPPHFESMQKIDALKSYLVGNNATIRNMWFRYRLGDMVRWKNHADNEKWGYQYHKKQFPNSIATQYLSASNGTRFHDYKFLSQIVKERTTDSNSSAYALLHSIDYAHSLVIHLRTGDVIDNPMLKSARDRYVKGKQYYIAAMNRFKAFELNQALFITGWHQGSNHTNSILYIQEIMKEFALNGYETSLRLNENPDEDFLIMCNSQYFVKSGGGFSLLIAEMVTLNGGTVYGFDLKHDLKYFMRKVLHGYS